MTSEETFDAVVAEMRNMPNDLIVDMNANFVFTRYADRLEKAHNREIDELRKTLKGAGYGK